MEPNKKLNKKGSCLEKAFLLGSIFLGVLLTILLVLFCLAYRKLSNTRELARYAGKKLSKPGKHSITIENLGNTLPIITAENVIYEKISQVSTLTVCVTQLEIYPDYLAPKVGNHSFYLGNGSLLFDRPNFIMYSPRFELSGSYRQKRLYIASSTFEAFGGSIEICGHLDSSQKPSPYYIFAKLVDIRLQDLLKGTKNRNTFTGNIHSDLEISSYGLKKNLIYGTAKVSIKNGTYHQREITEKAIAALRKIGLQDRLKQFAESLGNGSFALKGDFNINGKIYETQNTVISMKDCQIRFSGSIGPKSALNGSFWVKVKNYSEFCVKVKGENSRSLTYDLSSSDKARIASIVLRETGKKAESEIKEEGRRFNKKFNNRLEVNTENFKDKLKDANVKTKKEMDRFYKKAKKFWGKK